MDSNPFSAPVPEQRTQHQATTAPAVPSQPTTSSAQSLPTSALYIGGTILLLGALWLALSLRSTAIKDNDLPLTPTTYEKRDRKLVRGEILGGVTGKTDSNVELCPITKGTIVKQARKYHLSCPKESLKVFTTDSNGTFTGELTPGSYLMNVELSGTEKSTDIPARLNVHTGERATFTLTITSN